MVWRTVLYAQTSVLALLPWNTQGTVVCRRWLPKQSSSLTHQQARCTLHKAAPPQGGTGEARWPSFLRKSQPPRPCAATPRAARGPVFFLVVCGFLASKLPRWPRPPIGSRTPLCSPSRQAHSCATITRQEASAHLIGYRSGVAAGGSHWAIASPPRCEWLASRLNRADVTTNAPVLGSWRHQHGSKRSCGQQDILKKGGGLNRRVCVTKYLKYLGLSSWREIFVRVKAVPAAIVLNYKSFGFMLCS